MLVRLSIVFYTTSNDELFGDCDSARKKSSSLSMDCTGTQFRLSHLILRPMQFILVHFVVKDKY